MELDHPELLTELGLVRDRHHRFCWYRLAKSTTTNCNSRRVGTECPSCLSQPYGPAGMDHITFWRYQNKPALIVSNPYPGDTLTDNRLGFLPETYRQEILFRAVGSGNAVYGHNCLQYEWWNRK